MSKLISVEKAKEIIGKVFFDLVILADCVEGK